MKYWTIVKNRMTGNYEAMSGTIKAGEFHSESEQMLSAGSVDDLVAKLREESPDGILIPRHPEDAPEIVATFT